MSKKQKILNAVFLLLVFGLTIYFVFRGEDLEDLLYWIGKADWRYWIICVFCVIFFIMGESVIIHYLMRTLSLKVKLTHCFLYSFVGFFVSCITPSASGGQPAQLYYMSKDDLPLPTCTLVLMLITITYKMVLVLVALIVFIVRPARVMHFLEPVMFWAWLGLFLNIIAISSLMILVFHPTLASWLVRLAGKILHKLHLYKLEEKNRAKVESAMEQYHGVADYYRTHRMVIYNAFLITVVQRGLLFLVTWLVLRSFGISGEHVITIVLLQGMISEAVDMLPLPGGMGISEKLFLTIFAPICGELVLPVMVVSRGISYYSQLLISAVMTVFAHIYILKHPGGGLVREKTK